MESTKDSNPYTAPAAAPASEQTTVVDFASIIRRWERLRIFYNAVLVTLVLLVTFVGFPQHVLVPGFWAALVLGGVLANLCFMTGPAIEGYGTYFGFWNKALTLLLFLAGLGFTAMLAVGSVIGF